jgi:hypothetical protein
LAYGRTVAVVILPDGWNLNHEISKAGCGWWFVKYAKRDEKLRAIETEARTAKRGLWADAEPVAPWEWGRCCGAVEITTSDGATLNLLKVLVLFACSPHKNDPQFSHALERTQLERSHRDDAKRRSND